MVRSQLRRSLVLGALTVLLGCGPSLPPASRPLTQTPVAVFVIPPELPPSDTADALPPIESFELPGGILVRAMSRPEAPVTKVSLRFADRGARPCDEVTAAVATDAWLRALRWKLPTASWYARVDGDDLILVVEQLTTDSARLAELLTAALRLVPDVDALRDARNAVVDAVRLTDLGGPPLATAILSEWHDGRPRALAGAARQVTDVAALGCLQRLRATEGAVAGVVSALSTAMLRDALGSLPRTSAVPGQHGATAVRAAERPALSVVHRETRGVVVAGLLAGPAPSHPDHAAFEVIAHLFGGHGRSRLYQALRERLGLTYWSCVNLLYERDRSALVLMATVDPTGLRVALDALDQELTSMEHLSEEELDVARSAVREELVAQLERPETAATTLARQTALGLEPGWLAARIKALEALRLDDVRAVAARYFHAEGTPMIVVGEKRVIGAQLQWSDRSYELIDSDYESPPLE